ncbi:photosynthetic complex putative assembly protein PuhB [Sphingomonas sp. ASV193]|uniref:photosynthetic complex putative assembly protein PuhB n=1 Tax=Sphingomonas sp. ASV193 TaxID=3144405 RepID=UPI0032E8A411
MTEYDHEPIRGLPGDLPEGEHIVWQGAPDARAFARDALHARLVAAYFAVLLLVSLAEGSLVGAGMTVAAAALVAGLIALFSAMVARTTVYTLTNRRIVLRIGIALNSCINVPLAAIGAADLRARADGHGDLSLTLTGPRRIGYAMLWPHARPWRIADPQPMLRALPDAAKVAALVARTSAEVRPIERPIPAAPAAQVDIAPRPLREVAA